VAHEVVIVGKPTTIPMYTSNEYPEDESIEDSTKSLQGENKEIKRKTNLQHYMTQMNHKFKNQQKINGS